VDDDFSVIAFGLVAIIVIAFLVDWYSLNRFKKCYDMNFQTDYCQRYLEED
jgi:hypothetical protein